MIAKLTGTVDSLGEDWAILDVNGVGYLVACSSQTLGRLRSGIAASLFTEMRLRDEVPHLYGFADRAEQDWFRLLTTVQGVGARVALAILSALAPEALALAVAAGDRAALSRAEGVGPKLATRIASELKDKAQTVSLRVVIDGANRAAGAPSAGSANAEAVSALVNLGYGRGDAFAAVAAAAGGADLPLDELIRKALKALSRVADEATR